MGNKGLGAVGYQCGGQRSQLLYEAAAEIAESADEWLGRGLLVPSAVASSGELRLPVLPGDLPQMRVCKRAARRPREDEFSDAGSGCGSSGAGGASSSSRGPRSSSTGRSSKASMQALEAASREYVLNFPAAADPECHAVEVVVTDSVGLLNGASPERDVRHMAAIVSSYCTKKDRFVVTVRAELGSVAIKRPFSPFRDAKNVEEGVRKALEAPSADLPTFAANYGNCVVEKAFCGGVLSFAFCRADAAGEGGGGAGASGDCVFDIQVGRDTFNVCKAQRGGEVVLASCDGRKPVSLDLVEKQVQAWCKSLDVAHRNAKEVVRLKLATYSKVEGITVPGALLRMDYEQTAAAEKAKEALVRASKTRNLGILREAVDAADAVPLDDPALPELRERRRQLDAAAEALPRAVRQGDVVALRRAIQAAEAAGLPEWERGLYDEATHELATLEESQHASRLAAASAATVGDLSHVGGLVAALCDAQEAGHAQIHDFAQAAARLAELVGEAAERAKSAAADRSIGRGLSMSISVRTRKMVNYA